MRLFVAVWPPEPVLQALDALPRPALEGTRWTARPSWHVTLRFIGDVASSAADDLMAGLRQVATAHPPVRVELGPATTLLGSGVLAVPVTGLGPLAADVEQATAAIGRPPETRPFAGHITLARCRGRRRLPRRLAGQELAGSWVVERLALVRSQTHPDGARYDDVATIPLTG